VAGDVEGKVLGGGSGTITGVGATADPYAVRVYSTRVVAVTVGGVVYRTTDGGTTWTAMDMGTVTGSFMEIDTIGSAGYLAITTSGAYIYDGTTPSNITGLANADVSPTNDTTPELSWTAATDSYSALDYYVGHTSPDGAMDAATTTGGSTSYTWLAALEDGRVAHGGLVGRLRADPGLDRVRLGLLGAQQVVGRTNGLGGRDLLVDDGRRVLERGDGGGVRGRVLSPPALPRLRLLTERGGRRPLALGAHAANGCGLFGGERVHRERHNVLLTLWRPQDVRGRASRHDAVSRLEARPCTNR